MQGNLAADGLWYSTFAMTPQTERASASLFGYPKIGRAGLGNELFAWARCFVWCRDNGAAMLRPQWRQVHIGPYLRFERDKRSYHRLFHGDGYVGGGRRAQALLWGRRVDEDAWPVSPTGAKRDTVVRFAGMGGYFAPLLGRHEEIGRELARITRPAFFPEGVPERPFIGVHIRLGDFRAPADEGDLTSGGWNYRIDLAWYAHVIAAVRDSLGMPAAPALICSDGGEEELREVLALPGTRLYRAGSAIGDLFALSSARVLVASGSSFSTWASFLGQVPTVWFPGQRRANLIAAHPNFTGEPELARDAALPAAFAQIAGAYWAQESQPHLWR